MSVARAGDAWLADVLTAAGADEAPPDVLAFLDATGDPAASPARAATRAGARTGRLGLAFAAGYREALRSLLAGTPHVAPAARRALAATEDGGGHPRAMVTTFDGDRLSGQKRFVTLGTAAERALVVARLPEPDGSGRPRLVVVDVALDAEGVTLEPLPPLPFCPELPHASVRFEGVRVDPGALLPGDGYAAWLKPFRTVEDLHVHAALLGLVVRLASRAGARALVERALALAAATVALAALDPSSPATHLALGGLLPATRTLFDALVEDLPASDERERLVRDAPLLAVAGKARAARLEAAWSALAAPQRGSASVSASTAPMKSTSRS